MEDALPQAANRLYPAEDLFDLLTQSWASVRIDSPGIPAFHAWVCASRGRTRGQAEFRAPAGVARL